MSLCRVFAAGPAHRAYNTITEEHGRATLSLSFRYSQARGKIKISVPRESERERTIHRGDCIVLIVLGQVSWNRKRIWVKTVAES